MSVRTRFAPSPTGFLHVGGARTALYSWLYAKKTNGKFILRIEDTDRERSTEEAIHAIVDAMEWLGLAWDEGPFYQMKRLERYKEATDLLINKGAAYRCTCSKERLEALRNAQIENKQKPRYDGQCRDKNLAAGNEPFVVRFRNPTEGSVEINDAVHGHVVVQNSELDDLVLVRTDGIPTYNFGVVVDDLDMNITHVIRGDDHIANTPRQINIIKALGGTPPIYAHVPTILGPDGKRLSKRHGAVSVQSYRDQGILPEALLNYLVRLGWSHGDQEIFSIEEMIKLFALEDINKAPAAFNNEKLLWLNQHYIKTLDPAAMVNALKQQFEKIKLDISQGPDLKEIIKIQAERAKTLAEMAEKSIYFYQDVEIDADARAKHLTPESLTALKVLKEALEALPEWKPEPIHQAVIGTSEKLEIKLGKLAQPLRVAVTGNTMSPPIDVTLALIGREKTLARLNTLLD